MKDQISIWQGDLSQLAVDAVVSPTCKSDFGFLFYPKLIHILKTRKCNFVFLSFALTYFIS